MWNKIKCFFGAHKYSYLDEVLYQNSTAYKFRLRCLNCKNDIEVYKR